MGQRWDPWDATAGGSSPLITRNTCITKSREAQIRVSSKNKGITNEETKNYEEKKTKQQTTAVEKKKEKTRDQPKLEPGLPAYWVIF